MSQSFFVWDPNRYSVHVGQMDTEHQKLISIMNKLYEQNEAKVAKAQLSKTLKELAEAVVKHFKSEETLFMALPAYDKKDVHKKIHEDLVKKYTEHVQKFETGSTSTLSPDFFQFLKVWLTAHIAGVDMKYGVIAGNKKSA